MSADSEEIPIPQGAYNINWDEIDENVNPFVTRTKVTGSPPPGANPEEAPLPPPPSALEMNGAVANLSSFGGEAGLKDCSNNSALRPAKKAAPKKPRSTESPEKKAASSALGDRIREMKRLQRLQQEGRSSAAERRPSHEVALSVDPLPEAGFTQAQVSPLPPPPPPAPPGFGAEEDEELPPPAGPAVQEDEEVSVKLMKPPPPMPPPRAPTTAVSSKPKEPPLPPPPPPEEDEDEDEEFYPAEEVFRADFLDALEKKTLLKSQPAHDVPRESVIVKFDPLLRNPSPALSIPTAESLPDKASSSPALPPPPEELLEPFGDLLPPPPRHEDLETCGDTDLESEPNLLGTPLHCSEGSALPNPVLTTTAEVDRMLAFSPASPSLPRRGLQPVTPAANRRLDFDESGEVMKYADSDLVRIRQEIEMSFQAQLLEKERQWDERLRAEQAEKDVLLEQSERAVKDCEEMKMCVIEYEKTLQDFLAQKSNSETVSKDSVEKILRERDQAIEDTDTIQRAFNDLHRRYDKSKQVIEAIKANEETLKKCLEESQLKLKRQAQKYQTLKTHAEERLEHASREIEKTRKAHEAELLKVQSTLKKAELQCKGLEAQVEQKVKENDELTKICDELIAKCGR